MPTAPLAPASTRGSARVAIGLVVVVFVILVAGLGLAPPGRAAFVVVITVRPDHGTPGTTFALGGGQGLTGTCAFLVSLDERVVGTARTGDKGEFSGSGTVPADTAPGTHQVSIAPAVECGTPNTASTTFVVDPEPTTTTTKSPTTSTAISTTARPKSTTTRPRVTVAPTLPPIPGATTIPPKTTTTRAAPGPGIGRSSFTASVIQAGAVSREVPLLLVNAGIAGALLLLIAFPAELFNKTLEEHYDEVMGWVAGPRRLLARLAVPAPLNFLGFALLAGGIASLVDPGAGLNRREATLLGGLAIAFVVCTLASEWPNRLWIRATTRQRGRVRLYPAALVMTGMCVAISRFAHFQPGYMFGILAGFVPLSGAVAERDDAKGTFVGLLGLLVVSVGAWLAWTPVATAASRAGAGAATLTFDALLCGVFCAGLEGLVFALMPFRFLDGAKVKGWSTGAWAVLYAVVLFMFVHVLLHPATGYVNQSGTVPVLTTALLFGSFSALSIGFWAWFRYRGSADHQEGPLTGV